MSKPDVIPEKKVVNEDEFKSLKEDFNKGTELLLNTSKRIEERLGVLHEAEERFAQMSAFMEKNAAVAKTKIVLDVGGKRHATSKATLLSIPNTYFHALLSSGKWEPDEDGCYFIDRNPKYFNVILDFLRTHEQPDLRNLPKDAIAKLKKDADYFQVPLELVPPIESDILNEDAKWLDVLREWFQGKNFELLHRATRDGWAAADFHRNCDNRGQTVVVVRCSNGWCLVDSLLLHGTQMEIILQVPETHPSCSH
jgi:hypothetical protein